MTDEESLSASEDSVRDTMHPDHPVTFADMTVFAADINNLFLTAITDLRIDILVLTEQLSSAERSGKQRGESHKHAGTDHQQTLITPHHYEQTTRGPEQ